MIFASTGAAQETLCDPCVDPPTIRPLVPEPLAEATNIQEGVPLRTLTLIDSLRDRARTQREAASERTESPGEPDEDSMSVVDELNGDETADTE